MTAKRVCISVGVAVAICLPLVQCSADERSRRDAERELALAPQPRDTTVDAADIVGRQRGLFAALQGRESLEGLVAPEFTIRNDHSMTLSDSGYAERRRMETLLRALNVRPVLDRSVVADAGDLLTYTNFQTYPLSANQIIVLARDERELTIMTSWLRSGADWRARSMVLNPSPPILAGLLERWAAQTAR